MLSIYGRCARRVVALLVLAVAGPLVAVSPAAGVAGYGDVADGEYFTDPVQWSVDNDVTGIDGACFDPLAPVSRGEAASYLWNMSDRPAATAHDFVDVDASIGDAVSWLSATGITTGTSETTFSPDLTLTRAQIAAFLYRYNNTPTVTIDPTTPTCDAPAGTFKTISAGGNYSCGIRSDDTATCWGLLTNVPAGTFKTISAGGFHTCGIRSDDTATCWGSNEVGQAEAPEGTFKTISAGGNYSCGIRSDDTATCWGSNSFWDGKSNVPFECSQCV